MKNKRHIITRFAPSPTGFLHLGTYRTAIFNFLFTRHHEGTFILRIEDTDQERSTKAYEENILESLRWLGVSYDEFYRQSERKEIYKKYLAKMIENGFVYASKEEIKNEGDRELVYRFKNPHKKIQFNDLIRGPIEFDTKDLGDFVIAKSLDEPTFHLAVVVDDFEMGVTHVIRGEDHISNTPRHILIQEAIGATPPQYAHLPMVLDKDRTKLSKRKGALSVLEYKNQGYLKEAILNYLSLVGWNPGGERELFSEQELINIFDLDRVHKNGAIFDETKLLWMNKEYIKKMADEDCYPEIERRLPEKLLTSLTYPLRKEKVLPLIKERISIFSEVEDMANKGEFDYYFERPTFTNELILPPIKLRKNVEVTFPLITHHLEHVATLLEGVEENNFDKDRVKNTIFPYADEKGRGIVLWPFRVALSGKEKSSDPFEIADILGKEETLYRLKEAIGKIKGL